MNRRTALRMLLSTAGVTTLAACQGLIPPTPLGRVGGDGKVLSLAVQDALRASPDTNTCLLYTSPSPRDKRQSRMPSSA